jgi:low affinity Fe/Cu permease
MKRSHSSTELQVQVGCAAPQPSIFERIAHCVTLWTGSAWAFSAAVCVIVLWLLSGPLFGFSDTWQLIINTSTTIVTFLMVFVLQRSQNKEFTAMQLKLNEIVAALEGASNRLINVEDLTEKEVFELHDRYQALLKVAAEDKLQTRHHSIEEAAEKLKEASEQLADGASKRT